MEYMTEEEAKELYEKGERPKVKFHYYYKYSFTLRGESADMVVLVSFGGDGSDIYKTSVDAEPVILPDMLEQLKDRYTSGIIKNNKTGKQYEFENEGWW